MIISCGIAVKSLTFCNDFGMEPPFYHFPSKSHHMVVCEKPLSFEHSILGQNLV